MKEILQRLTSHLTLDREEAKNVLKKIAGGGYNNSQISAFLTVYMMRMITVHELAGFRDALLELCLATDLSEFDTIDLCGTGGDGKNTFNISTLSSFVVAGAGGKVAKHGNYGVSSACGSSNVLEYLGYKFTSDRDLLRNQIDKANICFLHAPLFHPAMKTVAPIRRELGVKTFFNMLGPMVNPSFPHNQLVGVLREPRGPDVLPAMRWLPWVTFWQVTADMVFSTGVPDGHGHVYQKEYVDAWAAVLEPQDWTATDTAKVRDVIG